MSPAVVVVGSYVQDLAWRCADLPVAGETVVGTFSAGPGGKGSNQAIAAARAGAPTCFVGAIGRDVFGASAKAFYRAEKIAARLAEYPRQATGTAAILVDAAGQNEIVVALGANAVLARRDVDPNLIRRARVVVAQLESNLATTAHVFRLARRAGVATVLNPAPMRADFDPALLAFTDILIPNESEFVTLARRLRIASLTASRLAALGPDRLHALCRKFRVPTVIITLGAKGCFVSGPGGHVRLPAHRVKAIDTTGAGDAFVGGFAAGLVKFAGNQVAAARFGNTVAALSVTQPGTAPSMPRAAAIARFLRRAGRALEPQTFHKS